MLNNVTDHHSSPGPNNDFILETIQGKEALEADEVFARVDKGLKVQVKGL